VSWRGDEAVFARDLEQLPRLAAVAAQLGLFRTGTWVMPETPDRTSPRTAIFDLHVHRLSAIARILATHGSRLGLEVIGVQSFRTGRGEPFITRMKELDPLLAALRTEAPDVGVLVDTFHLYAAEESIEAGLQWGVESVVWVHVAEPPPEASRDRSLIRDTVRGLPAEHGTIPIAAWLKRLSDLGFDGPVTAEPLGGSKALQGLKDADIAATTAAALRSVWPPPATASPAKR
jgi:sugar phosphate isomerase/epimerase